MSIDEIRDDIDVEIAKNKILMRLVDDEERLFVERAMVEAENSIRENGSDTPD